MKKINILCSAADAASQNIKEHLLRNSQWEKTKMPDSWEGLVSAYENQNTRILEIKGHHIYEDRIDEKMKSCGFETDLIVVASKHKSNDGRSVLTAHFTGNPDKADFGGRPKELSVAAPQMLRLILRSMQKLIAGNPDYEVNMESTHHGPTDLNTPMVYAEIGSSEKQWADQDAGDIASKAILEACRNFRSLVNSKEHIPVAIGFGGGHYAARQTELILRSEVTFGHNFPDYQLSFVDKDMMSQAFERSEADFAYFDRKSMNATERERLSKLIEELGYVVLRESDIKEIGNVPWCLFMDIRKICHNLHPGGRFRITGEFKSQLDKAGYAGDKINGEITQCKINEELFQETSKANRKLTEEMLMRCAPIYMERKNGTLSNHILGIGADTKSAMQNVTNECIKILKEHYEIKYIPDEYILCIISEKFDPKAAKELGIPAGPMLGELARGNSVVVQGRTIKPEMVHKRKIKRIRLSD